MKINAYLSRKELTGTKCEPRVEITRKNERIQITYYIDVFAGTWSMFPRDILVESIRALTELNNVRRILTFVCTKLQ